VGRERRGRGEVGWYSQVAFGTDPESEFVRRRKMGGWVMEWNVVGVFCPTEPTRRSGRRESVCTLLRGRGGEKKRGKREKHDDSSLTGGSGSGGRRARASTGRIVSFLLNVAAQHHSVITT
jgi:hypothetical protein